MKNKQILSILVVNTILMSIPMVYAAEEDMSRRKVPYEWGVNIDTLIDLPTNHWAYSAVKLLMEELAVMDPKSSTQFMGNDLITRYQLADIFYRVVKKLENASGKKMYRLNTADHIPMTDVSQTYQLAVDAIVNDYGIMQAMPDNQFMGDQTISRYEIAFELYKYFLLIESQVGSPDKVPHRDLSADFRDLPADHWATKAVKNIVDQYQIMEGYPDDTFLGGKRLTRYETAATIREFIKYVDAYLIPFIATPTPAPTPTPVPTPVPSSKATPMPMLKTPLKTFDIRLGGDFQLVNGTLSKGGNLLNNSAYGPSGSIDIWLPKWGRSRMGLNGYGDYQFWNNPGSFTDFSKIHRLTAGGGLKWRLLGNDYMDDFSLSLGVGYAMQQQFYTKKNAGSYNNSTHGPTASLTLEWPWWNAFSLIADDRFTFFVGDRAMDRFIWRNDLFVGINIPAFNLFTFEFGYRDTRMIQADEPSKLKGDQGIGANLRFRF